MATENTPPQPGLWQRWQRFVEERFFATLSETELERFRIFFRELEAWNEKINLVSVRSHEELLWRHFADSLACLPALRALSGEHNGRIRIIDIGTGAGFPGIPVKIAQPSWDMSLVESIQKKCAFLEEAIKQLSLPGISVLCERAELLGQNAGHRGTYDAVLSRAVAPLSPNLELALPLLREGGTALIFKTEKTASPEALRAADRALEALGGTLVSTFRYTLPGEGPGYAILEFKKTGGTPSHYPRRPGIPEKKPL